MRANVSAAIHIASLILLVAGCGRSGPEVVVYTSQDQVYSKPILNEFTRQTGIEVRAFYDSEAVKTVGIANRLLAEKNNPQADVFWNNEELRTRQLAAAKVFRKNEPWIAFGYRSRRLVVNTNLLDLAEAPRTLEALTNKTWRGKVAMAYPLFGTTATHFLALREHWGEERWETWCRAMQANDPFVVDGNSVVVNQFVGKGEAVVGLTDSDDIAAGQREGLPVAAAPLMEDTMLIPNTVGIIRGGPNPEAAQRLSDYLQSKRVVERLVEVNALEGAHTNELSTIGIRPDWSDLLEDLETATTNLSEIFLRE